MHRLSRPLVGSTLLFVAACAQDPPTLTAPTGAIRRNDAPLDAPLTITSILAPSACLALPAGNAVAGADVIIASCDGSSDQRFTWQAGGQITLSTNPTLCVDAWQATGNDGDPVKLWTCNGGANQQWTLAATGEIVGLNGKCIDIPGANTASGTALIIWTCHNSSNQRWTVQAVPGGEGGVAELPRIYIPTTYPAGAVWSLFVPAGGDLQAALDTAQYGDEIVLAAGATYTGHFTLPNKGSGSGWIIIRGGVVLPAQGTRMTPEVAAQLVLPRLISPGTSWSDNEPVVRAVPGAHHYWLAGVEVTQAPATQDNLGDGLVAFGTLDRSAQATLADVPHDLVLDRSYVHGHPTLGLRRCVGLHAATAAVVDSYLSECHYAGAQAQAILIVNGPGPFKLVNNYLEGSGENVMVGGADISVPGVVPSDIEIRRNHFRKPESWANASWSLVNHFESKLGRRMLLEGNVFENNFGLGNNDGTFINLKPTYLSSEDITIRYNRFRRAERGLFIVNPEQNGTVVQRVVIVHNLFTELSGWMAFVSSSGSNGSVRDVSLRHNTMSTGNRILFVDGAPMQGVQYADNATYSSSEYGVIGSGSAPGQGAVRDYLPGSLFASNLFAGPIQDRYDNQNCGGGGICTPGDIGLAAVFENPAAGNWRIKSGSPYKGIASNGTDPGADIDAVERATAGVTSQGAP